MKFLNLLLLLSLMTFIACDDDDDDMDDSHPEMLQVEDLEINSDDLSFGDTYNADRSGSLRIEYEVESDELITFHELFFIVNGDEQLKSYLFRATSPNVTEIEVTFVFENLELLELEDQSEYLTEVGDELDFTLIVEDGTGDMIEESFKVILDL